MECFRCGGDHLYRECTAGQQPAEPAIPRGEWCGECDQQTRLIDLGDAMARCIRCHPLAWKPLAQHKKCGGCRQLVYEWDQQPCGSHQELRGPVYKQRR